MRDRILLNVLVQRDGMSVTGAARLLGMAPLCGVKWRNRYLGGGGDRGPADPGCPPKIPSETLRAVKKK